MYQWDLCHARHRQPAMVQNVTNWSFQSRSLYLREQDDGQMTSGATHLPELGTNLVAALASLDVDNLTHSSAAFEEDGHKNFKPAQHYQDSASYARTVKQPNRTYARL